MKLKFALVLIAFLINVMAVFGQKIDPKHIELKLVGVENTASGKNAVVAVKYTGKKTIKKLWVECELNAVVGGKSVDRPEILELLNVKSGQVIKKKIEFNSFTTAVNTCILKGAIEK
jgi:hypothetical protein